MLRGIFFYLAKIAFGYLCKNSNKLRVILTLSIMSKNELLKKIKSDSRFMPFNENYDFEYIRKYISGIEESTDYDGKIKAVTSIFFNQYYNHLNEYFTYVIDNSELSKVKFLETLIALANRDLYLMHLRTQQSLKDSKEFHYDTFMNSSFQSSVPEFGLINAQAGLEAGHDGLNFLLNLTRKQEILWKAKKSNFNSVDNCAKLLGFSNLFTVVKSSYDIAIWEDYEIWYSKQTEELKIKCKHIEEQILNRIGEYRLERNIFLSKSVVMAAFREKSAFYKMISQEANKKRKPKRLKSVNINSGHLKYKIADGKEIESILKELLEFSVLTTYYPFIKNEELPNMENLNLFDLLLIYSEVQNLFRKAFEIKKIEIDKPENMENFHIQIFASELVEYVYLKTKYSKSQIKQAVSLFINSDLYYDIWERPLIKVGNYIVPVLLPLLNGNLLRIVDYWLEQGGFDLDSRGKKFEQFIKQTLKNSINRKGYKIEVIERNIFTNAKGSFEEIDLIIELKTITIIAEVKCIKYPFDPRDYHNMHKRLKDGAEQINRKIEFLKSNGNDFGIENFLSKKIVSVVITNYPIFSGYVIQDVPIIDFSLLENYFINGSLNKSKVTISKRPIEYEDVDVINYYKNEDEMCKNLQDFFLKPIPVIDKFDSVEIRETQISLPSSEPKIIMDYISFKDVSII